MFDGINTLDLSVDTDALLQNDRLLFPLRVDERTGAVLNRPRRATDQGLIFTLKPRQLGGSRCELRGSLHRYHNDGQHNANDYTAVDLLATIDDLVKTFRIDPYTSRLNNIEFGVNIRLPFPVADVLSRLICYKGVPFVRDTDNSGIYYQATLTQYVVKLYDKGKQYNLSGNLLRVEVKVFKMQFLTTKRISLNTIADLLNVETYPRLGSLLLDTFSDILFDEPSIKADKLTSRERERLLQGRNPRYWQLPARETFKDEQEYNRVRKRLQREGERFRTLLTKHRQGDDLQTQTAKLIKIKWDELTVVSPSLLTSIQQQLAAWKDGVIQSQTCPNIAGSVDLETSRELPTQRTEKCPNITDSSTGEMSQNYPLGLGEYWDKPESTNNRLRATSLPLKTCSITGVDISSQRSGSRFISATTVGALYYLNRTLFDKLANRFLTDPQRSTGNLNQWAVSIAHNVRNVDSNRRRGVRQKPHHYEQP